MNYLIALICPPLALAVIGRPSRAFAAAALLLIAAATWASGPGVVLAAFTILWACRDVGDRYAERELEEFHRLCREADAQRQ